MKYVFGNWKMNHGPTDAEIFLREFAGAQLPDPSLCKIGIAPPAPILAYCEKLRQEMDIAIHISSQNSHWENEGAFTGETSPLLLREIGIQWTLIGHSERRQYFGETDKTVNLRIKAALSAGLSVIFCIGETLAERDAGDTEKVLKSQIELGLEGVNEQSSNGSLILAYEPVWAIGTGKTATADLAESTHQYISEVLGENRKYPIIYGGSVKAENAASLLRSPNIHGALVGGASLKADSFLKIIAGAC